MLSSIRNIASSILFISILSLAFSFAAILVTRCDEASNCAAAISLYKTNVTNSQSTAQTATAAGLPTFEGIVEVMQVVSAYGLLFSVAILIVLEARELHYLKLFLISRRKHKKARA